MTCTHLSMSHQPSVQDPQEKSSCLSLLLPQFPMHTTSFLGDSCDPHVTANVLNWGGWGVLDCQKLKPLKEKRANSAGAGQRTRRGEIRREETRKAGGKLNQFSQESQESDLCPDKNKRNALMVLGVQDCLTCQEDEENPPELSPFSSQIYLAGVLSSKRVKSSWY